MIFMVPDCSNPARQNPTPAPLRESGCPPERRFLPCDKKPSSIPTGERMLRCLRYNQSIMFRACRRTIARKTVAVLTGCCLSLAVTLNAAQSLAMSLPPSTAAAMPAAVMHGHDAADMPMQPIMHGHDGHADKQTPCHQTNAVCCPGFAAVLPAHVPLLANAEALPWDLPHPMPLASLRAVEIFRPPACSS
jgi:hypothetical protein